MFGCAAHDCHNALKWSVFFRYDEKEILRDAFTAVAALRQSMDVLTRFVGEWVSARISFKVSIGFDEQETRRELWNALNVEPDVAQVLSETLQLWWSDGRLWLCNSQESNVQAISDVVACLLGILRRGGPHHHMFRRSQQEVR